MNKLTTRQKIYLTGGGSLAVLVLFIGLIVSPLIDQIHQESQKLIQEQQIIDSFYRDWENLRNSQKSHEDFQENLAKFNVFLPPAEAIKFITAVENIAQKTQNQEDISALEKRSGEPRAASVDAALDFQIALAGSFPDLIKFLIYLENASYYNDVNFLQISRVSYSESETKEAQGLKVGDVKSTINLSVYQP
jgi:hypothetical protein